MKGNSTDITWKEVVWNWPWNNSSKSRPMHICQVDYIGFLLVNPVVLNRYSLQWIYLTIHLIYPTTEAALKYKIKCLEWRTIYYPCKEVDKEAVICGNSTLFDNIILYLFLNLLFNNGWYTILKILHFNWNTCQLILRYRNYFRVSIPFKSLRLSVKGGKPRLNWKVSECGRLECGSEERYSYTIMYISHLTKNNLPFLSYLVVSGLGLNLLIPNVIDTILILKLTVHFPKIPWGGHNFIHVAKWGSNVN